MIKYLIVLAALIALAASVEDDVHAEVKSSYSENDGFGHFKYGHDISNGVEAKAEGNVNGVRGEYFYIDEKGDRIKVTYTADSTGFHPIIGA